MSSRLHRITLSLALVAAGYALGVGPFSEWVTDVGHMLGVYWLELRTARGPGGSAALLVAGFLLGEGLYLLVRQLIARIPPRRAQRAESLASWDPSLQIPRRFGLHRYLEHCNVWSSEDPSIRIPSLALFKISGLGRLNREIGTVSVTRLLQRISAEMRVAALPDTTSALSHWLARYFPRPLIPSGRGMPLPRFPTRWSGSTFALAFRELDAVQAVVVCRDLATWISAELDSMSGPHKPRLRAGIAVGASGVTSNGLTGAAIQSLQEDSSSLLTVVYDETDLREPALLQFEGVDHRKVRMERAESRLDTPELFAGDFLSNVWGWFRIWGPTLGCFIGSLLLLLFSGKGSSTPAYFAWPESLQEVQVVDSSGSKKIRLMRASLPPVSSGGWTLSDVLIVQGDPNDGPMSACQVHVSITNHTGSTYYVSAFDFTPVDANGSVLPADPTRMVQMQDGIGGRWMHSGDTWSGWLVFRRRDVLVTELHFEPDKYTRIALKYNSSVEK